MAHNIMAKLLAFYSWMCYYCTNFIKPVLHRLWIVLWTSETTAVRFWFGLASLAFSIFIFNSHLFDYYNAEYHLMSTISPTWIDSRVFWGSLFILNGTALLYGIVFRIFNTYLLLLEGVLGLALWGSSAVAVFFAQGTVGAHTVVALLALWVLARYPTHKANKEEQSEEILAALSGEDVNDR